MPAPNASGNLFIYSQRESKIVSFLIKKGARLHTSTACPFYPVRGPKGRLRFYSSFSAQANRLTFLPVADRPFHGHPHLFIENGYDQKKSNIMPESSQKGLSR
jgi:hypothetical protein